MNPGVMAVQINYCAPQVKTKRGIDSPGLEVS